MRVINKLFEIPEELSGGISKVTVIGFNRMLIENYMHIMEYQDIFIRINKNILTYTKIGDLYDNIFNNRYFNRCRFCFWTGNVFVLL